MSNEESAKEVGEGESKGGGGQQASNSEPPQSSSSYGNHQANIKKNSILRCGSLATNNSQVEAIDNMKYEGATEKATSPLCSNGHKMECKVLDDNECDHCKGKISSNSGMAYRCASCDEDSCQSCADKGQCVRKWSWRKGWKGKIIDVMENNDVAVKVEWDGGSFSISPPNDLLCLGRPLSDGTPGIRTLICYFDHSC